MQFIRPEITTICIGQASSMAAVLLAAGTRGKRLALPNSRIVIHQPVGEVAGPASNVDIHAREILRLRELMISILVTGNHGPGATNVKAEPAPPSPS